MLQVAAERAENTTLKTTLRAQRDETQVWAWGRVRISEGSVPWHVACWEALKLDKEEID